MDHADKVGKAIREESEERERKGSVLRVKGVAVLVWVFGLSIGWFSPVLLDLLELGVLDTGMGMRYRDR
ncbi:predicted protein [Sclerotinia sclerotiorum 1980 UF-70]|uniref:Uncharacterized protein n=1 Tax=Sclerotinia sclerotiorum (strain ATCC 18683 / 1980 / Ss-1) TaxID=665079 RepID=A7ED93_SCLS1|nr:predicted protein [Sclerotinia sclerotiorum 1980 UF-70]EDO00809.1 predicted protein [Sclerotinia sclerotiorum 1980 UF-70]